MTLHQAGAGVWGLLTAKTTAVVNLAVCAAGLVTTAFLDLVAFAGSLADAPALAEAARAGAGGTLTVVLLSLIASFFTFLGIWIKSRYENNRHQIELELRLEFETRLLAIEVENRKAKERREAERELMNGQMLRQRELNERLRGEIQDNRAGLHAAAGAMDQNRRAIEHLGDAAHVPVDPASFAPPPALAPDAGASSPGSPAD